VQIGGAFGASQTWKAQMYQRLPSLIRAQIDWILLGPPFVMECSSGVLRGPALPVTGPTSASSYPVLTCVPVVIQYVRRSRPQ